MGHHSTSPWVFEEHLLDMFFLPRLLSLQCVLLAVRSVLMGKPGPPWTHSRTCLRMPTMQIHAEAHNHRHVTPRHVSR